MILTRSSLAAASMTADIAVPSSSIRMKSHPSRGAPAPSPSRIQPCSSSSPHVAYAGPYVFVGASAPSSSAGHTISPSN